MSVKMYQGSLPHIYHIDIKNDGVFVECAVMKKDVNGNVFYFPISSLDSIDRRRLVKILNNRNAATMELWDLMDQVTLNNGTNALQYFHQLVNMLTPSGREIRPQSGRTGVEGQTDTRGEDARRDMEDMASAAANAAATAAAKAATDAIRQSREPQRQVAAEKPAAKRKPRAKAKAKAE